MFHKKDSLPCSQSGPKSVRSLCRLEFNKVTRHISRNVSWTDDVVMSGSTLAYCNDKCSLLM